MRSPKKIREAVHDCGRAFSYLALCVPYRGGGRPRQSGEAVTWSLGAKDRPANHFA